MICGNPELVLSCGVCIGCEIGFLTLLHSQVLAYLSAIGLKMLLIILRIVKISLMKLLEFLIRLNLFKISR